MHSHNYEYLIALGSNSGERLSFLQKAVAEIQRQVGPVVQLSNVYETPPIGAADQTFLNAAVLVLSNTEPSDLMVTLLAIEQDLGRVRTERWGNRTIDLDIVLAQESSARALSKYHTHIPMILDTPTLTIPHPEMLKRDFVVIPAADVAASWLHPKAEKHLEELVAGFLPLKKHANGLELKGGQHTHEAGATARDRSESIDAAPSPFI